MQLILFDRWSSRAGIHGIIHGINSSKKIVEYLSQAYCLVNCNCDDVVWSKSAEVLQVYDVCVQDAVATDRPEWPEVQEWLWLFWQPTVAGLLLQVSSGTDATTEEGWWVLHFFIHIVKKQVSLNLFFISHVCHLLRQF